MMTERKNGCFNYPEPLLEVEVQDGYHNVDIGGHNVTKIARYVKIPYQFSAGCKYAEHGYADQDKGCTGCKKNLKK